MAVFMFPMLGIKTANAFIGKVPEPQTVTYQQRVSSVVPGLLEDGASFSDENINLEETPYTGSSVATALNAGATILSGAVLYALWSRHDVDPITVISGALAGGLLGATIPSASEKTLKKDLGTAATRCAIAGSALAFCCWMEQK